MIFSANAERKYMCRACRNKIYELVHIKFNTDIFLILFKSHIIALNAAKSSW